MIGSEDDRGLDLSSGFWYRDPGMELKIACVLVGLNNTQPIPIFLASEWCRPTPLRPRGDNLWSKR